MTFLRTQEMRSESARDTSNFQASKVQVFLVSETNDLSPCHNTPKCLRHKRRIVCSTTPLCNLVLFVYYTLLFLFLSSTQSVLHSNPNKR